MKKLLAIIFFAFLATNVFSADIHFAVMGDRTGGHVEGVFEKALVQADMLDPDLIINVGDLIEGYSENEQEITEEWNELLPHIRNLSCPFYFTPGNHDITNDVQDAIYRSMVGEPYYSFDHGKFHFIVLDNSRLENSSEYSRDQIEWLEEDLKKNSEASQIFVFYHKPFWFETLSQGQDEPLHDLFVKYGVDAVFTGHYHIYFSAEIDGIKYTGVGSSGAETHLGILGPAYHFLMVSADDKNIEIAVISLEGVHSWDQVTVPDIQLADKAVTEGVEIMSPVQVGGDLSVVDASVRITVRNLLPGLPLSDTLKIDLPEGWAASFSEKPVYLEPGDSVSFEAIFNNSGNLYPLPSLSINYPVRSDMSFSLAKNLRIQRKAYAVRVDNPMTIDGVGDENCWKEPVTVFFSGGEISSTADDVKFYFAYDTQNLYLLALCHEEDMSSIIAEKTIRDENIFSEDCVGYFIMPDTGKECMYQIYCNTLGTLYDALLVKNESGSYEGDNEWNGEIESAVNVLDDYWVFEAKIPVSQFEGLVLNSGDVMLLNFRRKQPGSANADWQTPIEYDPATFGILIMK
ncbi:metallophosphoesterase [candidate division WOR-3 bacterium]|nr:metallophosphoesterase [candidate division WOR-3 bacterium]